MADNKYGRIFTTSDVEKILELAVQHGPELDTLLEVADEEGVRFKFAPDEPLFILRGRDKRAAGAIMHYRDHQARTAPDNHVAAISAAFTAFNTYRQEHPGEMKEPD